MDQAIGSRPSVITADPRLSSSVSAITSDVTISTIDDVITSVLFIRSGLSISTVITSGLQIIRSGPTIYDVITSALWSLRSGLTSDIWSIRSTLYIIWEEESISKPATIPASTSRAIGSVVCSRRCNSIDSSSCDNACRPTLYRIVS